MFMNLCIEYKMCTIKCFNVALDILNRLKVISEWMTLTTTVNVVGVLTSLKVFD